MNRFNSWVMVIILIIGSLLILFSLFVHITNDNPKKKDLINTDLKVFKSLDSLSTMYEPDAIFNHNNIVISTLQERESIAYNLLVSRESIIKQTRTIYIAILVVLLSLLFNSKNEIIGLNIKMTLLIFTILVMYLVEVHSEDLLSRQENCVEIIARSTEGMVNSTNLSSTWFTLDYGEYLHQIHNASQGSFFRKLMKADYPEIDQFGIYLFPLLMIFIYFFRTVVKQVIRISA